LGGKNRIKNRPKKSKEELSEKGTGQRRRQIELLDHLPNLKGRREKTKIN